MSDDEIVKLLSRISENTRMTRQYVGWLAIVALFQAAIIAAWLLGAVTVQFEPVGF